MIQPSYDDGKKHVHVLSYGGGTQSTALLLMALKGEINNVQPDFIIFSDTGWEPQPIYDWVNMVNDYIKRKYNKEIIIVRDRNIRDDIINADTGKTNKFMTIPAFIKKPDGTVGLGRRQCTADYKIRPINRKIRELLGYEKRQRVKEVVHVWKGISTDEIQRAKPNRFKWLTNEHPLIDIMNVDRSACIRYVEKEGLGTPAKSSCIGCPFHDDRAWLDMKKNDPKSWEDAVYVDKELRKHSPTLGKVYLHRSCVPLDEVDFGEDQEELDFFNNECEGMCGI